MKYEIILTKEYKKSLKSLSEKDKILARSIVNRLANGERLEAKYRDHKLSGTWSDFSECHLRPDLLLIYKKQNENLILTCVKIGKHSSIFKR